MPARAPLHESGSRLWNPGVVITQQGLVGNLGQLPGVRDQLTLHLENAAGLKI